MINENRPEIIAESADYLVLYKPPLMHSVPLKRGEGGTLLEWAALRAPEILRVKGRKDVEGGLLHRLDYGTSGLVLAARNDVFYQSLLEQQKKSLFIKEYTAFCREEPGNRGRLKGFPPPPVFHRGISGEGAGETGELLVKSGFRAYGRGGKSVRPLAGGGALTVYTTRILSVRSVRQGGNRLCFRIGIDRGFRHQIRCHLAWLGFPILNDALYGGEDCGNYGVGLALKAVKLRFNDPETGGPLVFEL